MVKTVIFRVLLSIYFIVFFSECEKLLPKIVGGDIANIRQYPHSAFLFTSSKTKNDAWRCGASIVNQKVLLTACHCIYKCGDDCVMMVKVGHVDKTKGKAYAVHRYKCHENYKQWNGGDIAVLTLATPLLLNDMVQRVVLLPKPPYNEKTEVAGWGRINEGVKQPSTLLHFVSQFLIDTATCMKMYPKLPKDVICAKAKTNSSHPYRGDSGSALVVRGYIQIGLVSYGNGNSDRTIIYTDVGHYYNWIRNTAMKLICSE